MLVSDKHARSCMAPGCAMWFDNASPRHHCRVCHRVLCAGHVVPAKTQVGADGVRTSECVGCSGGAVPGRRRRRGDAAAPANAAPAAANANAAGAVPSPPPARTVLPADHDSLVGEWVQLTEFVRDRGRVNGADFGNYMRANCPTLYRRKKAMGAGSKLRTFLKGNPVGLMFSPQDGGLVLVESMVGLGGGGGGGGGGGAGGGAGGAAAAASSAWRDQATAGMSAGDVQLAMLLAEQLRPRGEAGAAALVQVLQAWPM